MPLVALAMTFATLVVVANVIAVKLLDVNGWAVPAGVLAYPFTFLVTDTISELYGRKTATKLVWMGFFLSAVMVLLVYVAKILPAAGFWDHQEAFETIFGSVPRVVLASLTAYLISQHGDVILFHFFRRLTNKRHLWLRNIASTTVSQAVDTVLFISIAFTGTVPAGVLWNLMYTQYLIKVGVAVIDTSNSLRPRLLPPPPHNPHPRSRNSEHSNVVAKTSLLKGENILCCFVSFPHSSMVLLHCCDVGVTKCPVASW